LDWKINIVVSILLRSNFLDFKYSRGTLQEKEKGFKNRLVKEIKRIRRDLS